MYIVDEIKTLINIIVKYYVITSHSGQNVKIFFSYLYSSNLNKYLIKAVFEVGGVFYIGY